MENVIERKNPFCVISLAVYGDYDMHDIQTNSSWNKNPYGEAYAVVSDEMVEDILATRGFCDITVEDGTVISFVAREIPEIPETEVEPTAEEVIIENQMIMMEAMADQYEQQQEVNLTTMEVQATIYEELLAMQGVE